jgi:hypothetical protein
METKGPTFWGVLILCLVVGGLLGTQLFPKMVEVEVLETVEVDNTDYSLVESLEGQVAQLEADFSTKVGEYVALDAELLETQDDLDKIRELQLDLFDFSKVIQNAISYAEDEGDITWNGTLYEGDDNEFEIEDYDAEDCKIQLDNDFNEGKVFCDDVDVETDDDDDITCDVEVEFDNGQLDDADFDNCS